MEWAGRMERGGKQYWEEVDWMILERKDWDGLQETGEVGSGLKWTALEAMVGGLCRGQRRYIKDWFLEDFLSC